MKYTEMHTISKKKLLKLIEPHLEKYLFEDNYKKITINAKELLTHTRFDIAFKLLFLEMMSRDVEFAQAIYKDHIRAHSLGKFREVGNEDKNSIDKFIEEFRKTYEDIKVNGFDDSKTLVPLSRNSSIVNGAHRVASSIFTCQDVECVKIDRNDLIYDYNFFYSRNVPNEMLDVAATKFAEYADGVHVAFIFNTSLERDKELEELITKIVYRKVITLNPNGTHNLISQIFHGDEWLGSEYKKPSSKSNLLASFKNFESVKVIAFQADSLDHVLKIKSKVRGFFKIEEDSIYITETKEEAVRAARLAFNDNGIHFLNYSKPNKYISTHKKIDKFEKFIKKNELKTADVVFDNELVLSVYGLREVNNIDFFIDDNDKLKHQEEGIECHDDELEYHKEEKSELIYNPKNYFYYKGLKFVSINQIYKMKKNRNEAMDRNDLNIMEEIIEDNGYERTFIEIRKTIHYQKNIKFKYHKKKLKQSVLKTLKKSSLYGAAKRLYRFFKSKR